ncbi:hypothetical protein P170DRAFT_421502 [Aspergillus steynii IBT 23096]|uniref:Secreted protein n=1 Tax=Aspergillus steynii IBT 23096 TaxID=1392250 RepID=A0A2I2GPR1_9EURO|nr:uncharacterized protein P170DRAFT_421502 [Aspergillus steynii IBT 23096]PLB54864.1 hypothetical protein P170DRAFT_421502 [Aspergillus steynii IBT 23096]
MAGLGVESLESFMLVFFFFQLIWECRPSTANPYMDPSMVVSICITTLSRKNNNNRARRSTILRSRMGSLEMLVEVVLAVEDLSAPRTLLCLAPEGALIAATVPAASPCSGVAL